MPKWMSRQTIGEFMSGGQTNSTVPLSPKLYSYSMLSRYRGGVICYWWRSCWTAEHSWWLARFVTWVQCHALAIVPSLSPEKEGCQCNAITT
jgi:hypothetical protein